MAFSAKFRSCLKLVLNSEGGNDDDKDDKGGRTGQGITQAEYTEWLKANGKPNADVFNMSAADRDQIYYDSYWLKVSGDSLPLPVAYAMFDAGVLSGVGYSRKLGQRVCGVKQDGQLGPISIAALNAVDKVTFINRFCDLRREYLASRSTAWKFGVGWKARQDRVQKQALGMIKLQTPIA